MKIKYLTLICSIALTACGGDDSNKSESNPTTPTNPTDPTTPTNPTNPTSCALTYENWVKLKQTNTLAQAEATLGCSGKKESDTQVQNGVTESSYIWGDITKGPSVLINFRNNSLSSKNFMPAKPADSSCFPNGTQISNLKIGQTRAQAETTLGCKGAYTQSVAVDDTNISSSVTWGKASDQFLLLNFTNDILDAFSLNSANTVESSCEASLEGWMNVTVGDDYNTTKTKLGCDGALASITAVNQSPNLGYTWGKAGTKSFTLISFENGKVIAKSYTAKTGAVSSCNVSTDKWQTITIGSNYSTVKNAIGCDGILSGGTAVTQDTTNLAFTWGAPTGEFTLLSFENNKLSAKSYSSTAKTSTCIPTEQQSNQIKIGDSINTANQIVGCAGVLSNMTQVSSDSIVKGYLWGSFVTTNTLLINTDNDLISSKNFMPKQ